MQADLQDPRHFVLMALQLAGFPIADIPGEFLQPAGGEGFDLTFSMASDCTLTLGWDEQACHWLVMSRLVLQTDASHAATMALAVNAALPAGLRLQADLDSTSIRG